MSRPAETPISSNHQGEAAAVNKAARATHSRPPASTDPVRIEALERENVRLQLLVAELLMKNQRLRKDEA